MENLVNHASFWRGKKVFLTGQTGFKGSWLSLWLGMLGAEVLGFSNGPVTQPNLYTHLDLDSTQKNVVGDICNYQTISKVISDFNPQIVIHFAAQAIVRHSYKHPLETFSANIMGTANLLEACRNLKDLRVILNVTSDKCYANKEWLWGYRENEELGGADPYSCSKACSELITSSYRQSFYNDQHYNKHGVAIASARAGNVIGGGDWSEDRLVPDCIRAIIAKESITLRNPNATRPWQYVLDPLNGYLILLEKLFTNGPEYNGGWNFGPHDEDTRTVKWIVDEIFRKMDVTNKSVTDIAHPQPHEANFLKLDCSKAASLLGWKAKIPLEKSIDEISVWSKAFMAGKDMKEICMDQIRTFCEYKRTQ